MVLKPAFAALLVLISTASPPGEAVAMSAPDSTRLPALDEACRHASLLRLQTYTETLFLHSCRAHDDGIRGWERGGYAGSLTAPPDSLRLVRWSDIEGLDRGYSNVGLGAGLGAVAGLLVGGLVTGVALGGSGPGALGAAHVAPAIIATSGLVGTFVGAAAGAEWHSWDAVVSAGAPDSTGARGRRRGPRSGNSIAEPAR